MSMSENRRFSNLIDSSFTSSLVEYDLKVLPDGYYHIWVLYLAIVIVIILLFVYLIIPGAIYLFPSIFSKIIFVNFGMCKIFTLF